jgi:hypothetical protein
MANIKSSVHNLNELRNKKIQEFYKKGKANDQAS